jgi:hypothetical protein
MFLRRVLNAESGNPVKTTRRWVQTCLLYLALLPVAAQAQFVFTTNNDGSLNVQRYTGSGGAVTIPDTTNGLPVTSIGSDAFENTPALNSVTIGANVATIGANAFSGCVGLADVTFGNSVASIGDNAFYQCALANVTIPAGVTNIADDAFGDCVNLTVITVAAGNPAYGSLGGVLFNQSQTTLVEYPGGLSGSYAIPSTVTNIGSYAFANCLGLTSVTIPTNVASIGYSVFYGCPVLTSITVTAGNPAYSSSGGVLFNQAQTTLIAYPEALGGPYSVPASVTSIADYAFANNLAGLGTVTIPASVTNIGCNAFSGGKLGTITVAAGNPAYSSSGGVLLDQAQTTVIVCPQGFAGAFTIPATVTTIGTNAFADCSGLTNVTMAAGVTNIGDDAFKDCFQLGSVAIPAGVTSIGNGAFAGCLGLTNVTIPASVTCIGNQAFSGCLMLTNVVINPGATNIGYEAFSDCRSLSSITIPAGVTNIGCDAFSYCYYLTGVSIPGSVISIGNSAFAHCPALTAITVDPSNPAYSSASGVLFNQNQTTLVEYPAGLAGAYTIPGGVTAIGADAFYGCTALSSITITNSVTCIGNYAFYGCTGLTNVVMGTSVTNIGADAFQFCANLPGITIPAGVTSVGSDTFYYCINLASVNLPGSVGSIGNYAFELCTSLTNLTVPGSVTNLQDDAFLECVSLSGIYFLGNSPTPTNDLTVFYGDMATAYYLPGTMGWGAMFDGLATGIGFLPNPVILNSQPGFGLQTNGFSFLISWATNGPVVVDACTNLGNPVWLPIQTNTLSGGTAYFSDPAWTNYPARFYRAGTQ